MSNNYRGFFNRFFTASMLVLVLIACEKMPENQNSNFSPSQNQVQK